jgi:hypothetical protein
MRFLQSGNKKNIVMLIKMIIGQAEKSWSIQVTNKYIRHRSNNSNATKPGG